MDFWDTYPGKPRIVELEDGSEGVQPVDLAEGEAYRN